MDCEKRSGLSTQPYRMYILVNSGDLSIKLDFYYMRSCVSFIKANTAINEINLTLQHETNPPCHKVTQHREFDFLLFNEATEANIERTTLDCQALHSRIIVLPQPFFPLFIKSGKGQNISLVIFFKLGSGFQFFNCIVVVVLLLVLVTRFLFEGCFGLPLWL